MDRSDLKINMDDQIADQDKMSQTPPNRLFSLSNKGLQRLERVNHANDFTFIVGNEHYPCPSFVAEFLAPRVCSLRSQDTTIDELYLETADPNHYFSTLLKVGFRHDISVDEAELGFVRSVCREMQNCELFEKTLFDRQRIGGEGGSDLNELKTRLAFCSGIEVEPIAMAIASHFHELSFSDFDELSPSALESIVSNPNLVLRTEDSLFEVIHRQ
jgi:hypothetical protein